MKIPRGPMEHRAFPLCLPVSSVVCDSATLWMAAHQAPPSMGLSRQECWSGLPCPPPGERPVPGIKLRSLTSPAIAGGFFSIWATWAAPFGEFHLKIHRDPPSCSFPGLFSNDSAICPLLPSAGPIARVTPLCWWNALLSPLE